jgi:ABC-2 type transport system permease protein
MATDAEGAAIRRRGLVDLFDKLFHRGRLAQRNAQFKPALERRRRFWSMVAVVVFGLFLLVFAGGDMPPLIFATFLHAYSLLVLGLGAVNACGNLLFSEHESDILLHRPVSSRTILQAKVEVILRNLCLNAVAFNAVAMLLGVFRESGSWRFLPAHLVSLGLNVLFATSVVVLAYHACLRLFGRERLNSYVTILQVGVALFLILGAQLVPRLVQHESLGAWTNHRWFLFLPPAWFGSLDALLVTLQPTPELWLGAGLAVGLTLLVAWLAFVRLADGYEEVVVALGEQPAARTPVGPSGRRWIERLADSWLLRPWLRDPVQRAGFLVALAQFTRVRGVKVRVYPRIVQFAAYPLMFVFGGLQGDLLPLFVFLPGIFGLIGYTVSEAMLYSEEFAGAELFRFVPLRSPGPLFYGARKAALLLTFLPILSIWAAAIVVVTGAPLLLWQLAPAVLFGLLCGLIPPMTKGYLIFSQTEPTGAAIGKGCLIQILPMLAGLALGGVSCFLWRYGWYAYYLPVVIAGYFLVRHLFRKAIEEQALGQE